MPELGIGREALGLALPRGLIATTSNPTARTSAMTSAYLRMGSVRPGTITTVSPYRGAVASKTR